MDLDVIREKVGREIDIMIAEVIYWMPSEEMKQEKLSKLTAHKERIMKTVKKVFHDDVRVDFIKILREAIDNPEKIRKLADKMIDENQEHQSPVVGSSRQEESARPANHNQNPFRSYDSREMFDTPRQPIPSTQNPSINRGELNPPPQAMSSGYSNSITQGQNIDATHGPMPSFSVRNMPDVNMEPRATQRDVVEYRREHSPTAQSMYATPREPDPKRQTVVDNRQGPAPSMQPMLDIYNLPIRPIRPAANHQEPLDPSNGYGGPDRSIQGAFNIRGQPASCGPDPSDLRRDPDGKTNTFGTLSNPGPSSQGANGFQGSALPSRQDPSDVRMHPEGRPDPYEALSNPGPSSQGAYAFQGAPDPLNVHRRPTGNPDPMEMYFNKPDPSTQNAFANHGEPGPSRQEPFSGHRNAASGAQTDNFANFNSNLPPSDEKMDCQYQTEAQRIARALQQCDSRHWKYSHPPLAPLSPGRVQPPSPTPSASSTHSVIEQESGKSYVNILQEFCAKRHMPIPEYRMAENCTQTSFIMKVIIILEGESMEFVGPMPCPKKSAAKALAALVCLEYLAKRMFKHPYNDIRFLVRQL